MMARCSIICMIVLSFSIVIAAQATLPTASYQSLAANALHVQYFGKNKVNVKQFEWLLHKSEHFDIYYYESESVLAPEVAEILEQAYDKLSDVLGHELSGRTPIILYQSHNDFRQTNIILDELPEGVGGFAELFKHRIVIPFTGSRRDLREVLFHELTHIFQYDIMYQKPFAHIYTGEFLYSPPQWFIEGMAEYFAEDMDAVGEMVLRDAVINGETVPLTMLDDFYALGSRVFLGYKEGQSALMFIADEYGQGKIGELMQELKLDRKKDLDKAMKNVMGIGIAEFDRKWQKRLKERYYPLVKERKQIDDIATQLTRSDEGGYLKFDWSPSSDLIATITTADGRYDIVILSASTGEVVMKPVSELYRREFEEIQSKGSGISWSPDGDKIAFFARKDKVESLFIYDLIRRNYEKVAMPFDACWSPEWAPDGDRIAFVALKEGRSDIYLLSLRRLQIGETSVTRLTHTIDDEGSISWSPDGSEIVFSAERNGWQRLIRKSLESGAEHLLTPSGINCFAPQWIDNNTLLFVADPDGFNDIFLMNMTDSSVRRIVKSITGVFYPNLSPDGQNLVFVGYHEGKQNIFSAKWKSLEGETMTLSSVAQKEMEGRESPTLSLGRRRYRAKLMLDAIFTDFAMSSDGQLQNVTQLVASDMMGNHRIILTLMGQSGYFAPDFIAYYYYLALKPDFGVALYNYHVVYTSGDVWDDTWYLERYTGLSTLVSYPFDRYRRVDVALETVSMPVAFNFWSDTPVDRTRLTYLSTYLVGDTIEWGAIGPRSGHRYSLGLDKSLTFLGSDFDTSNVHLDYRRYFPLGKRDVLAARLMGAGSFGSDDMIYYLGGIDTIRGYSYQEMRGSRLALINAELRVPFIDEIRFGFPIPWAIRGIQGIAFLDIGSAWRPSDKPNFADWENNWVKLVDAKASIGLGMRLSLGIFDLNFSYARRTDLSSIKPKSYYHFGIGQSF